MHSLLLTMQGIWESETVSFPWQFICLDVFSQWRGSAWGWGAAKMQFLGPGAVNFGMIPNDPTLHDPKDRFSQRKETAEIKISKKSKAACHRFITKYLLWARSHEFDLSSWASCMWAAEGPAAVGQIDGGTVPGESSPRAFESCVCTQTPSTPVCLFGLWSSKILCFCILRVGAVSYGFSLEENFKLF